MKNELARKILKETPQLTRLKVRLYGFLKVYSLYIPLFGIVYILYKTLTYKQGDDLNGIIPTNQFLYTLTLAIQAGSWVLLFLFLKSL